MVHTIEDEEKPDQPWVKSAKSDEHRPPIPNRLWSSLLYQFLIPFEEHGDIQG